MGKNLIYDKIEVILNLAKECDYMKKLLLVLAIVFIVLTFVGAIFVLTSYGTANAGYAVIPMVIALACLAGYRTYKNKEN